MKHRILIFGLLLALLGGVAWLALRGSREPVYQGHRQSYWLERFTFIPTKVAGGHRDPEAEEALRHIGTNAIPTLLRLTRAGDSALKLRLIALAEKQSLIDIRSPSEFWSGGRYRKAHWSDVGFTAAPLKHLMAYHGFSQLGAAASNAVPELIEIHDANISVSSQIAAAEALGCIGPAAKPALPSLLRTLAATNRSARYFSVKALGLIHPEPQVLVPALIESLSDPDHDVRYRAAGVLEEYGPDASAVDPALRELLRDSSFDVRMAATNALKRVDPAAAARAGIK